MIQIDAQWAGLIGDGLVHIPYMHWLCTEKNTSARIVGLNTNVQKLLGPTYAFEYVETLDPNEPIIRVNLPECLGHGIHGSHMTQSFFRQYGGPEPAVPIDLDLKDESCGLPPGVVIAPFSRSDCNHNKLWEHERWLEVVRALRAHTSHPFYVIGAAPDDDASAYAAEGIEPVFNRPLAQVVNLMRQAPLVMSIEGGMSHLAHYSGIGTHVLLYPGCTPICWATNPRAKIVTAPMPSSVQVKDMVAGARQVIG